MSLGKGLVSKMRVCKLVPAQYEGYGHTVAFGYWIPTHSDLSHAFDPTGGLETKSDAVCIFVTTGLTLFTFHVSG